MEIRSFSVDDADEVVALWNACELVVPWNDPVKDIDRKLAHSPELFLVGEVDFRIVASAMGGFDGHRGWIYYLAVSPDCRRMGLGRAIVAEVTKRLLEQGCPKVNIMVRESNQAIVGFYKALGYQSDPVVTLSQRIEPKG